MTDPTITDPDKYVMVTLSGFERRLVGGAGETRDVTPEAGEIRWLDAQTHSGDDIGDTPAHVIFVELKESSGP